MKKKLFAPAPSSKWTRNATVDGRNFSYIAGYYDAAKALCNFSLKNRIGDNLFYPICFNYRHFVELMLKHLILMTEEYHEVLLEIEEDIDKKIKSRKDDVKTEHSLQKLIQWLCAHLILVEPNQQFDADISKTINQMHSIDPDGQTFRYPHRKDGKLCFPDKQLFDVEMIKRRMEEVFQYLGGVDAFLDYNIDLAKEIRSEYRAELGFGENDW